MEERCCWKGRSEGREGGRREGEVREERGRIEKGGRRMRRRGRERGKGARMKQMENGGKRQKGDDSRKMY